MASRLMRNFNALKEKGMTDSAAMKKAMSATATGQAKVRASDKELKHKRERSSSKVKMAITGKASMRSHSPAGKKHLRRKRAGL